MPDVSLVLATANPGKCRELERLLGPVPGLSLRSLRDFPGCPIPAEDCETFEANARHKALHYARRTGLMCVADDSGLVVEALGGQPGVRSARFAGDSADDAQNRAHLLARMRGVPAAGREASFHCVIVVARPGEVLFRCRGETHGRVLEEERGQGGFGYDSLFFSDDLGQTFAECSREDKDRVSHRGRALALLLPFLRQQTGNP